MRSFCFLIKCFKSSSFWPANRFDLLQPLPAKASASPVLFNYMYFSNKADL